MDAINISDNNATIGKCKYIITLTNSQLLIMCYRKNVGMTSSKRVYTEDNFAQ